MFTRYELQQLTSGDVGAPVGEPVGGIVPLLDLLPLPDFAAYNVDAYDILDSSPLIVLLRRRRVAAVAGEQTMDKAMMN